MRPPLPLPPSIDDDEAATVWVDRMIDEVGRSTVPNTNGSSPRPGASHDDNDEPEEDPEEEPEEDSDD